MAIIADNWNESINILAETKLFIDVLNTIVINKTKRKPNTYIPWILLIIDLNLTLYFHERYITPTHNVFFLDYSQECAWRFIKFGESQNDTYNCVWVAQGTSVTDTYIGRSKNEEVESRMTCAHSRVNKLWVFSIWDLCWADLMV